uniref:AMP-activated protein kinase glycogen-binding domain-containing protein n=2 Tax=Dunaliella tertiolecta TaxID=3047 RepID=A0A7S3QVB9_DUNTE|mmetsp:Transcript_4066/g.9437  ORF Transcript_4066/g.9437 Transcript_4066/m.9437 type:complete len:327 (+) Transcript_4066:55-1035(+)
MLHRKALQGGSGGLHPQRTQIVGLHSHQAQNRLTINLALPEKQPVVPPSMGRPGVPPGTPTSLPASSMQGTGNPQTPTPTPKADAIEGLKRATSVQEKLHLLQKLQQQSTSEETSAMSSPLSHQGTRMVDARAYTASIDGLRRANVELNLANQYIRHLEQQLQKRGDDLATLSQVFKKTSLEYAEVGRVVDVALAAVKYGAPGADAKGYLAKVQGRLAVLEKAMKEQREAMQKLVPVKVPIKWDGGANSVRVMGSFDFWTRGVDMSSPDADGGDSMQRSFETTLSLVPGTYLIKFLVDNQWRCAPGWPIESSSDGDNNVLHVDPLP